jgi:hypothetical protein
MSWVGTRANCAAGGIGTGVALTEAGVDVFGGVYPLGTELDDIEVTAVPDPQDE